MAIYVVAGEEYEIDDGIPPEQAAAIALQLHQQQVAQATQETPQAPQGAVTEASVAVPAPAPETPVAEEPFDFAAAEPFAIPTGDTAPTDTTAILDQPESAKLNEADLAKDATFVRSSKILFQARTKRAWTGTDEEAIQYGLEEMGMFNWNIVRTGVDAALLQNFDDSQKAAFGYLMETYDKLDYSWANTGRAAYGILTDPTNWLGVLAAPVTGGASLAGVFAAKTLGKQAAMALLKPSIARAAVLTAAEGAIWSSTADALRQAAEIQVNPGQEWSTSRNLTATGVGAVVGGGLGAGFGKTGAVRQASREASEAAVPSAAAQIAATAPNLPTGAVPTPPAGAVAPTQPGFPAPLSGSPRAIIPTAPAQEGFPMPLAGGMPDPRRPKVPQAAQDAFKLDTPPDIAALADNFNPASPAGKQALDTAVADMGTIRKVVDLEDFEQAIVKIDPDGSIAGRVMEAVRKIAPDGTVANLPSSYKELRKTIAPVVEALEQFNLRPDLFADVLQRAAASPEQTTVIKASVMQAADMMTKVQTRLTMLAKAGDREALETLKRVSPLQTALSNLSSTFNSASGSELGFLKGGILVGDNKGLTPENIMMQEMGIPNPALATEKQFLEANWRVAQRVEKRVAEIEKSAKVQALNAKIDGALKKGDWQEASEYMDEIDTLIDMVGESEGWGNKAVAMFNEAAMSGALSTSTLTINMVPMMGRFIGSPAMNAVFRGGGEAAVREAAATYGAMWAARKRGFATGKMFFEYEQAIFRDAGSDTFEYSAAIPGRTGQFIRFIPRMLGRADQAMKVMFYEGEVAGELAYAATQKAKEMTFKNRKERSAWIQTQIEQGMKGAYADKIATREVLSLVRKEGIKRGFSGPTLTKFVKDEIASRGELLRAATNQAAADRVSVATFGDSLNKDGLEGFFKKIDDELNAKPVLRSMWFFLRATIKIFKAGTRITPGFQFFVRDFRKDLAGVNGELASVRAHGELITAYAMLMGTMSNMVFGNVSGSGDPDYKRLRGMKDTGFEQYNIKLPFGMELNYRNLDPISTPIKITANFVEALLVMELNRAEGKDSNFALETAQAAVFAYVQAIKDANLGTQFNQAYRAIEDMFDPEISKMDTAGKFLAEKVRTVWPNSLAKAAKHPLLGGDDAIDPRTGLQVLVSRVLPNAPSIPRQYDLLGNVRKIETGLGLLIGVDIDANAQSANKYTPQQIAVLSKLSQIERQTGSTFYLPFRKEPFTEDLRTIYTSEGIPYYDAWNREIAKDPNLMKDLERELVKTPNVPIGNDQFDAWAAERARKLLNNARNRAWERVVLRETAAQDKRTENALTKWRTEQGLMEVPPTLYNQ